ncbi:alpha/beta hydrolase [Pseudomonas sp. GCM10022188]|uniref:alpha/beta hydrolase n=1 Tax=Pseudomonas TaxID=286 RepID=UPI001E3B42BC|nr:alpha/beta hydrolase [Pseudomonas oryzagri]MCC6076704.1 alpha/beta hydrolase [Pseudomonas oryzagri]
MVTTTTQRPDGASAAREPSPLPSPAVAPAGAALTPVQRAVALFIGGAGDKRPYFLAGPYRNMAYALNAFDQRLKAAGQVESYQSLYLGYHEIGSASAIDRLVAAQIPDQTTPIYIVGHSLGAWNGAHLAQRLSGRGYRVAMLVTLDPVGSGLLVRLGSRMPYKRPAPRCDVWINVRAEPGRSNASDLVARLGRKWQVAGAPDIDEALDTNHANAWTLLSDPLHDGRSAADHLLESIARQLRG